MRPSRLTDRRQPWCPCVNCLMGPWKGSAPSTASWPRAAVGGGRLRDRSRCLPDTHSAWPDGLQWPDICRSIVPPQGAK